MRDMEFQNQLLKKTESPSKALEIAISIETVICKVEKKDQSTVEWCLWLEDPDQSLFS